MSDLRHGDDGVRVKSVRLWLPPGQIRTAASNLRFTAVSHDPSVAVVDFVVVETWTN